MLQLLCYYHHLLSALRETGELPLLLSRDTMMHETSRVTEQSTDLNPNRKESFYGKLHQHSVQWSEICSLNGSVLIQS